MSIQPFHTSNGSGLCFSLQQIILSLVLSLALCDFPVKAGIFFVNKFFFSEIQLCANRHHAEGMVSGFLLSSTLYQTQARSRTLICALEKMCSPYLLRFFSLSTKDKASCLLLVVVSLLHLLPHKFISRLSRVWDSEMVTCVPCHRGLAPFHPQKKQECDVPIPMSQRQKSAQQMTRISHSALWCTARSLTPAGWVSQLQTEWEVPGFASVMEPDTESDTIPQSCPAPKYMAPIKNLHPFPETHLF